MVPIDRILARVQYELVELSFKAGAWVTFPLGVLDSLTSVNQMITHLAARLIPAILNLMMLVFTIGDEYFLAFTNPEMVNGLDAVWWNSLYVYVIIMGVHLMLFFLNYEVMAPSPMTDMHRFVRRVITSFVLVFISRPLIEFAVALTNTITVTLLPRTHSIEFATRGLMVLLSQPDDAVAAVGAAIIGGSMMTVVGMVYYFALAFRMAAVYFFYGLSPIIIGMWVADFGLLKPLNRTSEFITKIVGLVLVSGILMAAILNVGAAVGGYSVVDVTEEGASPAELIEPTSKDGDASREQPYMPNTAQPVFPDVGGKSAIVGSDRKLEATQNVAIKLLMLLGSQMVCVAIVTSAAGVVFSSAARNPGGLGGTSGRSYSLGSRGGQGSVPDGLRPSRSLTDTRPGASSGPIQVRQLDPEFIDDPGMRASLESADKPPVAILNPEGDGVAFVPGGSGNAVPIYAEDGITPTDTVRDFGPGDHADADAPRQVSLSEKMSTIPGRLGETLGSTVDEALPESVQKRTDRVRSTVEETGTAVKDKALGRSQGEFETERTTREQTAATATRSLKKTGAASIEVAKAVGTVAALPGPVDSLREARYQIRQSDLLSTQRSADEIPTRPHVGADVPAEDAAQLVGTSSPAGATGGSATAKFATVDSVSDLQSRAVDIVRANDLDGDTHPAEVRALLEWYEQQGLDAETALQRTEQYIEADDTIPPSERAIDTETLHEHTLPSPNEATATSDALWINQPERTDGPTADPGAEKFVFADERLVFGYDLEVLSESDPRSAAAIAGTSKVTATTLRQLGISAGEVHYDPSSQYLRVEGKAGIPLKRALDQRAGAIEFGDGPDPVDIEGIESDEFARLMAGLAVTGHSQVNSHQILVGKDGGLHVAAPHAGFAADEGDIQGALTDQSLARITVQGEEYADTLGLDVTAEDIEHEIYSLAKERDISTLGTESAEAVSSQLSITTLDDKEGPVTAGTEALYSRTDPARDASEEAATALDTTGRRIDERIPEDPDDDSPGFSEAALERARYRDEARDALASEDAHVTGPPSETMGDEEFGALFCDECGSAVKLENRSAPGYKKHCSHCGHTETVDTSSSKYESTDQQDQEPIEERTFEGEDFEQKAFTTEAICPDCGNNEARTYTAQIRAADESETRFFVCTDCDHKWRGDDH